jgi:transcription initiation factor TFIIA small subunit
MSYQLYRNTTLGNTLQESIDEMIQVTYPEHRYHHASPVPNSSHDDQRPSVPVDTDRFNFFFVPLQYGQITPALGMKILLQFDKAVNNSLANRVKSKITFKV